MLLLLFQLSGLILWEFDIMGNVNLTSFDFNSRKVRKVSCYFRFKHMWQYRGEVMNCDL